MRIARSFILGVGAEIEEPKRWEFDGGAHREAVYDHNFKPPRLVRRVGHVKCLSCRKHWFFSEDVVKVRLCDMCKSYKSE